MLHLITVHYLGHHLPIYHHLIHFCIEHLHLLCHFRCIKVIHLLIGKVSQITKAIHKLFVIFHCFYLPTHKLHFHSSSLATLG